MASREPPTIFIPWEPNNSTCGYCGPPGGRSSTRTSYHAAEGMAHVMSCRIYQELMDRGWRRSGTYYYKPDLRRSCCPQYTIKLDALEFRPSKSQRKIVNRFNRHIIDGEQKNQDALKDVGTSKKAQGTGRGIGKGNNESRFNLADSIRAAEITLLKDESESAHRYEVTLEPASFTREKFELYQSYQTHIHNDDDSTPSGFTRFLCKSALVPQSIAYPSGAPSHLPQTYGSFHQLHRVDGQLIAMSVVDVVPGCVSSVYYIYDKKWERFSMGKLSAMREASLVKEMHDAGLSDMKYLYLGFYIHTCAKMKYKGDYSPSYLLDPEDYSWVPLNQLRSLLDQYHYASCARPDRCLNAPAFEPYPPQIPSNEVLKEVRHMLGIEQRTIISANLIESDEWQDPSTKKMILRTLNGLGNQLAMDILLKLK